MGRKSWILEHQMSAHSGKTAIVTGASTGIGRASAEALAQAGFTVFGTSRRAAGLRDVMTTAGPPEGGADAALPAATAPPPGGRHTPGKVARQGSLLRRVGPA